MATATPEGRVKTRVKKVLGNYRDLWYFMPVPYGFGKPVLDYLGCFRGCVFAIETKAPGKKPTARQEATIQDMQAAGIRVFVIDDEAGCEALSVWLDSRI